MKVGLCLFQDDVCIQTEEGIKHCKLIAVHAGLERDEAVDEQLKTLKAKDTRVPKVGPLSGRASVWEIPKVGSPNPAFLLHRFRVSDQAFHLAVVTRN